MVHLTAVKHNSQPLGDPDERGVRGNVCDQLRGFLADAISPTAPRLAGRVVVRFAINGDLYGQRF
jgi:hypothetical protein